MSADAVRSGNAPTSGSGAMTQAVSSLTAHDFAPPRVSPSTVALFERLRAERRAATFDELTLEDRPSTLAPGAVQLDSFAARRVRLHWPVLSAAMDTVTGRTLALAIAKLGGCGVLHRNASVAEQCDALTWVRRKIHSGGMIDKPICFRAAERVAHLQHVCDEHRYTFSSFPIIADDGSRRLLGLVTRDELDFAEGRNVPLGDIMKRRAAVVTAPSGTTSAEAYATMRREQVKKLPVVGPNDELEGMYVWRDVSNDQRKLDSFSLDDAGHFLVGAAVGCGAAELERARALVDAGCRLLVIDSSHGACQDARDLLVTLRREHAARGADAAPLQIIVGNIASYAAAKYLLEGDEIPDALKVGIGPGSICTTRRVTGTGVPQMTAIAEVCRAVRELNKPVPVIADGGMRSSGDIVKALAVGASAVMLGSMLAGAAESAGSVVKRGNKLYKQYRGMGSRSAMAERSGSRLRYNAGEAASHADSERLTRDERTKVVPEGVEGLVELVGPLEPLLTNLMGGVGGGCAHSGASSIVELQERHEFWIQSNIGAAEGRVHDVMT